MLHDIDVSRTFELSGLSITDYDGLIKLIYEGISEPIPWSRLVNSLLKRLGANYVTLILRPPATYLPWRVVFAGAALPGIAATYENIFYATDPFVNLPPNRVMMIEELIDESDWLKSAIYREFLKPLNIRYFMGADLDGGDGTTCSLRLSRRIGSTPFTEQDRMICTLLLTHLTSAMRLLSLNEGIEAERQVYSGTLERLSVGTIILDKKGQVLNTNQAADQILAERDGISIMHGALHTSKINEKRELDRLIEQAIVGSASIAPGVVAGMSITRSFGRGNLGILIRSAPVTEWSESSSRPAVIIIIRDSKSKVHGSQELMRRLYGLTPAEATLALNLLDGLTIDEAANNLSISRNTARCQLRAIFAKTGVTRQTELMSVLLTGIIPLG